MGSPSSPQPSPAPHHLLQVDSADAAGLLLHLLHGLPGQVEVGLQVVAHHGQPQSAQQQDGPQSQRVKGLLAHPERKERDWGGGLEIGLEE